MMCIALREKRNFELKCSKEKEEDFIERLLIVEGKKFLIK